MRFLAASGLHRRWHALLSRGAPIAGYDLQVRLHRGSSRYFPAAEPSQGVFAWCDDPSDANYVRHWDGRSWATIADTKELSFTLGVCALVVFWVALAASIIGLASGGVGVAVCAASVAIVVAWVWGVSWALRMPIPQTLRKSVRRMFFVGW